MVLARLEVCLEGSGDDVRRLLREPHRDAIGAEVLFGQPPSPELQSGPRVSPNRSGQRGDVSHGYPARA